MRKYLFLLVLFFTGSAFAAERFEDMQSLNTTSSTACVVVPRGPFSFWCTADVYYALCKNSSCIVTSTKGVKWQKDSNRDTTSTKGNQHFCATQVSEAGTCVIAPWVN